MQIATNNSILRYNTYVFSIAALIGIIFPSSLNGTIEPKLNVALCALIAALFTTTLSNKYSTTINIAPSLLILLLFSIFTITSPLEETAPGGVVSYVLFLSTMIVRARQAQGIKFAFIVLMVINISILTFGYGTIVGEDFAVSLAEKYYKQFDDDLFEQMVLQAFKPVTFFASHSIASFAYFCLLCLNLRAAGIENIWPGAKILCLVSAIGYACLMPMLTSNTALLLLIPSIFLIIKYTHTSLPKITRNTIATGTLILLAYGINVAISEGYVEILVEAVSTVTSQEGNGFLGRYKEGGRLQPTYDYLIDNNFLPIGMTYSPKIALGDNFIAEYIVKISVVGYLVLLLILWNWLQKNIAKKSDVIVFFIFLIAADLAYPLLPYPRAMAMLPWFTILWQAGNNNKKFL